MPIPPKHFQAVFCVCVCQVLLSMVDTLDRSLASALLINRDKIERAQLWSSACQLQIKIYCSKLVGAT